KGGAMSIDWMNPSDDVVEAKRIGYEEGLAEAEEQIASLNTGLADHERMLDIVESALAAEVVAHADAQAELARLRAIVGRLPLTADGVPIMPEMVLCCPHGHDCVEWDYEDDTACCLECDLQGDPGVSCVGPAEYKLSACFSTPAAAAAAKETRDGNGTTDQA
ncbi:MAG TPA: hypothetical protein VMZ06_08405, partial [Candidatus Bathyarchaeia archaeon]|nr:hypothetical protein [Candidatus Bathyarchaeia archaeon]